MLLQVLFLFSATILILAACSNKSEALSDYKKASTAATKSTSYNDGKVQLSSAPFSTFSTLLRKLSFYSKEKNDTTMQKETLPTSKAPFLPSKFSFNSDDISAIHFIKGEGLVSFAMTKSQIFLYASYFVCSLFFEYYNYTPIMFAYNMYEVKKENRFKKVIINFKAFVEQSKDLQEMFSREETPKGFKFYPCHENDGQSFAFSLQNPLGWGVKLQGVDPVFIALDSKPGNALFSNDGKFVLLDNQRLLGIVSKIGRDEVSESKLILKERSFEKPYSAACFSSSLIYGYYHGYSKNTSVVHVFDPNILLDSKQKVNSARVNSYILANNFVLYFNHPSIIQVEGKYLYAKFSIPKNDFFGSFDLHNVYKFQEGNNKRSSMMILNATYMTNSCNDNKEVMHSQYQHVQEACFGIYKNRKCVYYLQNGKLCLIFYNASESSLSIHSIEDVTEWATKWQVNLMEKHKEKLVLYGLYKQGVEVSVIEINMNNCLLDTVQLR